MESVFLQVKSLVFHSSEEREPLATWRARYFGFERFLRRGFEVRVTLPLMSLSCQLFTKSRLEDFERWRTQALPCNSSGIVRSVLQWALLHGDEYGRAPLARGCLQASKLARGCDSSLFGRCKVLHLHGTTSMQLTS